MPSADTRPRWISGAKRLALMGVPFYPLPTLHCVPVVFAEALRVSANEPRMPWADR